MYSLANSRSAEKAAWLEAAFLLAFAAVCAFLFWKCPYGFGCFDEPFYLAVPYRLMQGDALFAHEWHLSQMASVLLYPFVSAFVTLTGGTEGIILAFRYFYTAVQAGVSLFLYYRLRNINRYGAAVAALGFLIYAPFGIMALSYNSMGILSLSLSAILFLTAQRRRGIQDLLSGLFLAAAVLCCPYLLLVYLYLTAAAFYRLRRGEKDFLKRWACVTAGAAAAAIAFAAFLLSRASFAQLLAALPEMFRDPEHEGRSFLMVVLTWFGSLVRGTGPVSLAIGAVGAVTLYLAHRDGKKENLPRWFVIGAVLTAAFTVPFATFRSFPNYLMYPINLFALYCMGLVKLPKCREIFWKVVVPGFLYSFCIHWSSNQHFLVMTSAMSVSFLGSVMIVMLTAQEIMDTCPHWGFGRINLVAAALCCLMFVQLTGELWVRYSTVFWEAEMPQLTYVVRQGPEKGLKASEAPAQYYETYSEIITSDSRYQQADTVLFLTQDTWMYLLDNKKSGSYSAWLSGVNASTADRLETYYQLNPEKLPDYVFVFSADAAITECIFTSRGYHAEQTADYIVYTR